MIRLLLVLFTLVGFLIFSYPFLVAQVSLGKRIPTRGIWRRSKWYVPCSACF